MTKQKLHIPAITQAIYERNPAEAKSMLLTIWEFREIRPNVIRAIYQFRRPKAVGVLGRLADAFPMNQGRRQITVSMQN
jgi:hypothetical protein